MPVPKNPGKDHRSQEERDRDAAVKRLAKANKIEPHDVPRHPGEADYDEDTKR